MYTSFRDIRGFVKDAVDGKAKDGAPTMTGPGCVLGLSHVAFGSILGVLLLMCVAGGFLLYTKRKNKTEAEGGGESDGLQLELVSS